MSAKIIPLPCVRVERFKPKENPEQIAREMRARSHAEQSRLSLGEFNTITGGLDRLADDDRRIIAHLLADELGYDLVPARDKAPKDAG